MYASRFVRVAIVTTRTYGSYKYIGACLPASSYSLLFFLFAPNSACFSLCASPLLCAIEPLLFSLPCSLLCAALLSALRSLCLLLYLFPVSSSPLRQSRLWLSLVAWEYNSEFYHNISVNLINRAKFYWQLFQIFTGSSKIFINLSKFYSFVIFLNL